MKGRSKREGEKESKGRKETGKGGDRKEEERKRGQLTKKKIMKDKRHE